ncbi:oxidoreductase [Acidipila rosea]|uniref:NAD(P)-dependent dehydrogenase (Short-subunit alcohol dehydrogenase family) n=1 Tax=Acidipila rosea TaxID=768535 RepID=A0A4R1L6M5_9BACT|nr:oxidoreductase [Acidipila rosea]TCK72683.1 NAD(P)-dependent dehydrogenase (short-subunit alcohol dehydrogenase family) [Acidipila rosea]
MAVNKWTAAEIPSQAGKLALITGANSGIGFHAAMELARAGAAVILACRDLQKGAAARQRILQELPQAAVELLQLDLANLASIRGAAREFLTSGRVLDLLVNNAGVMALPERQFTDNGFEKQIGTNHLGHFALTSMLLPAVQAAPHPRIVTVSSIAHRGGHIRFDDLNWTRDYKPWPAYRQSKLANLYFAFELERRLRRTDSNAISLAVHPGVANTNLFQAGPGQGGGLLAKTIPAFIALTSQTDAQGALPTLYGASAPMVRGGGYYGPDGFREMRGYPVEVKAEAQAYDEAAAQRLWKLSEQLTGEIFEGLKR